MCCAESWFGYILIPLVRCEVMKGLSNVTGLWAWIEKEVWNTSPWCFVASKILHHSCRCRQRLVQGAEDLMRNASAITVKTQPSRAVSTKQQTIIRTFLTFIPNFTSIFNRTCISTAHFTSQPLQVLQTFRAFHISTQIRLTYVQHISNLIKDVHIYSALNI